MIFSLYYIVFIHFGLHMHNVHTHSTVSIKLSVIVIM